MKRLVILVALLVGLLLCGLADSDVPVVAEEPEESSTEEQESSTILDYILSHPKGQELLNLLSPETIDKLAMTPIPPPSEPQPVVYGGCCDARLTEEEAKRHKVEPQEKPPYLREFREARVINTREGRIFIPLAEELEFRIPSTEEQEPSTMLDYILSHPKGQELLKWLSQEMIDELAITPMPPSWEPRKLIVVYNDSTFRVFVLPDEE